MGQHQQVLNWALQYLATYRNSNVFAHQKIVDTSYSVVYAIRSKDAVFYLKQTPKALFSEPKVLDFLHQQGCKNIPFILAENDALCCFLMTACGDISLRSLFKGKIDLPKLSHGIANYTNIQRIVEHKVHELLSLDIPDWRLDKFAFWYYQLIQQDRLLQDDGLTNKEIARLSQLYSICRNLCEELSQYKIPETIGHCDFHENNMLLDKKALAINIIDWGETVITHPFFSLQGCLWNITYFYKIEKTDPLYCKLQKQCVTPWIELYDEVKLLQALEIVDQLNGIYAALGYARMYAATEDQANKVRQDHYGSIAGCLRTFLTVYA